MILMIYIKQPLEIKFWAHPATYQISLHYFLHTQNKIKK